MDCPVCREPMIVLELNDVEIDFCQDCKGIWLDGGELEVLLEGAEGKAQLLKSFTPADSVKEKSRGCPICLKKMEKVWSGEDHQVMIDRCKKGDGIWFDDQELEDLIRIGCMGQDSKVMNLLKEMFGKT